MKEIKRLYASVKSEMISRLAEFRQTGNSGRTLIFRELCFCLLTPQSKAKMCWSAVEKIKRKKLFFRGGRMDILKNLTGVRFKNNKLGYIIEARKSFPAVLKKLREEKEIKKLRKWLVENIRGFGFKEASHFLRNIGRGGNLAILDRHILRNMVEFGLIEKIPKTLTERKYLELESMLESFSKKIGIPLGHLDLLLWFKEAGEVFK